MDSILHFLVKPVKFIVKNLEEIQITEILWQMILFFSEGSTEEQGGGGAIQNDKFCKLPLLWFG